MGLEEIKTHFFHGYMTNFYGMKCHALNICFSELGQIICQLQMFSVWVYGSHLLQIQSVPWIPLSHTVTMASDSIHLFVRSVSFNMALDSLPHCCILKYWIPSFLWLNNISNKYYHHLKKSIQNVFCQQTLTYYKQTCYEHSGLYLVSICFYSF